MDTLIKSVNPTFFLKKTNFESIIQNYTIGKYSNTTQLTHKPNVQAFMGYVIKSENKPVGFQIQINNITIIVKGREFKYNLCCNCRSDTTGFCSFGVPHTFSRQTDEHKRIVYKFDVDFETCSTECALSVYKNLGNHKTYLSGKYVDSETLLRLLHNLLFPNIVLENAPETMQLIPYGSMNLSEYRKKLHMVPEFIQINEIKQEPVETKIKLSLKSV